MSDTNNAVTYPWHGVASAPSWAMPTCVYKSDKISRPAYGSIPASEYLDTPEVLDAKVDMLLSILLEAKQLCVYTGAGISTASGVPDYASQGTGSVMAKHMVLQKGSYRTAQPTKAHRVIAALEKKGIVQHWLQQNHDGLAQKAGFPFEKLNEIHGSWWDDTNPVVKMSGSLRPDLYEWMCEWENKADCVLAMGTSFSGMSADSVAVSTAKRFLQRGEGLGTIIVSIQQTQQDHLARLRINAKCDDVMNLVATKLKLTLSTIVHPPSRRASTKTVEKTRSRSNSAERGSSTRSGSKGRESTATKK